jgi:hypothetical protein
MLKAAFEAATALARAQARALGGRQDDGDRGLVGTDEPIMFSPETEAKLRARAAVFADLMVKLVPGLSGVRRC